MTKSTTQRKYKYSCPAASSSYNTHINKYQLSIPIHNKTSTTTKPHRQTNNKMLASTLIAFGAAGLAAAAPTSPPKYGSGDDSSNGSFDVSNFVFGCTVGCNYYFDVEFNGASSAHCEGTLEDKDYVECKLAEEDDSERVLAFIDTTEDKNNLKLQYETSDAEAGTRYNYYGEEQVYAATSEDADKQEDSFNVEVSSVTGVA